MTRRVTISILFTIWAVIGSAYTFTFVFPPTTSVPALNIGTVIYTNLIPASAATPRSGTPQIMSVNFNGTTNNPTPTQLTHASLGCQYPEWGHSVSSAGMGSNPFFAQCQDAQGTGIWMFPTAGDGGMFPGSARRLSCNTGPDRDVFGSPNSDDSLIVLNTVRDTANPSINPPSIDVSSMATSGNCASYTSGILYTAPTGAGCATNTAPCVGTSYFEPHFKTDNTQIVYEKQPGFVSPQVFVANINGSATVVTGETAMTGTPGAHSDAQWSRDNPSTKIGMSTNQFGSVQVATMLAAGAFNSQVQLTFCPSGVGPTNSECGDMQFANTLTTTTFEWDYGTSQQSDTHSLAYIGYFDGSHATVTGVLCAQANCHPSMQRP